MARAVGIWVLFIFLFVFTNAVIPLHGYAANSIAAAISVIVCVFAFKGRAYIAVLLPLMVVTLILPIALLIAMGKEGFTSNSIAFFQSLDFYSCLQLICPLVVGALVAFSYGRLNRPRP
jgi:hypothetical protein